MKILPSGIAVIEGDRNASEWIKETGQLDYDRTVDVLIPLLGEGEIVVDVGAMLGGFSGPFKKAVGKSGVVHAFEPNPISFECLEHNCPGVVCHPCALGRNSGVLTLHNDTYNVGASWLGMGEGPTVPVFTLDEVARTLGGFSALRLLKIDVEGMEPDVIAGAMNVIGDMRPIIFVEINHGTLKRNGYTHEDVINPVLDLGYHLEFPDPMTSFDQSRWPQVDVFLKP